MANQVPNQGNIGELHPNFNRFYTPFIPRVALPFAPGNYMDACMPEYANTGGNGIIIARIQLNVYVNGTNNGTNYWNFQVQNVSVTSGVVGVWNFNTSTNAGGTWIIEVNNINLAVDSNTYLFELASSATGTPANAYVIGGIIYKLT